MTETLAKNTTLIVVPAYNEARRLNQEAFRNELPQGVDVLFVNDGSTDATLAALSELVKTGDHLFVIDLPTNKGKAEAVRQGFLWGLQRKYEFLGYWDADLATPITAIAQLLAEANRCSTTQVVLGSRVKLMGRAIERKAHRHYMGRVFATFVSLTLNLGVYDTQCGAKIFRSTEAMRRSFSTPFVSRWIFDVEILARLKQNGVVLENAVTEYPLWAWRDVAGSKLQPTDFLRAIVELFHIWRSLRSRDS